MSQGARTPSPVPAGLLKGFQQTSTVIRYSVRQDRGISDTDNNSIAANNEVDAQEQLETAYTDVSTVDAESVRTHSIHSELSDEFPDGRVDIFPEVAPQLAGVHFSPLTFWKKWCPCLCNTRAVEADHPLYGSINS